MPSSPMRTLPRPRTRVLPMLFVTFLYPVELPSANDRGDCAAAFDVVVIEGEIDVDDDEGDEEPEEEMMPETDAELAAHQGNDPGEHARQPRVAHAGVEREAGDGLKHECEEGAEVNEAGEGVVPGGDRAVHLDFKDVGVDDVDDLLLLAAGKREEGAPA